jgi:hypothetical protein
MYEGEEERTKQQEGENTTCCGVYITTTSLTNASIALAVIALI